DDDVIALSEFRERSSKNLFALPSPVHIGRVEEVYADIERTTDEWLAVHLAQTPRTLRDAVAHTAKRNAGNFQAGSAKIGVFHFSDGFRGTMQRHGGHHQGNADHFARRRNLTKHDCTYDGRTRRQQRE